MADNDLNFISSSRGSTLRGFSDIDDESVCLDEMESFVSPGHCCSAFPVFQIIRSHGKLCDVTLVADGQEFSAHRVVLAATIPYFHGMFTHDMVEAKKSKIPIHGMEASALEALINYAYCGDIQLTPSNVQSILMGASFFQLHDVREACCRYIMNRLGAQSVLNVRSFAQSFLCNQLLDATSQFIYEHFEEVVETPEFFELPYDDLYYLLTRDELRVSSEEKVFEAAIAWIKHDLTSRNVHVVPMLKSIRLPLLSPQYLTDKVAAEEVIRCNIQCRDLLDEARNFLLLPERRASLRTFRCHPRRTPVLSGYIYVVGGIMLTGENLSIVERYDPIHDRWYVLENKATQRSRVGVAVLNGHLYAMGGFDGVNRLRTVEKFDPILNKWLPVASMNYQRSALGAAALDGRLYVCGGYDGSTSMRTCEVYNPERNLWCMIPSMNDCRSAGGVVALGNKIYAMGGHNGLAIYDTVEVFDTSGQDSNDRSSSSFSSSLFNSTVSSSSSTTTTTRPSNNLSSSNQFRSSIPQTTAAATSSSSSTSAGAAAATTTTAAGSSSSSLSSGNNNRVNNFTTWRQLAPMLTRRCRHGVATLRDKIYVAGGYNGAKFLQSVECYDTVNNQWTRVAPMSIPRSRVALTATFGRLYAIGGYDGAANLKSVETFDEESNSWRMVSPLRVHEGGVGVGVVAIHELPMPPQLSAAPATSLPTISPRQTVSTSDSGHSFMDYNTRRLIPSLARGMSDLGVVNNDNQIMD